MLALDIFLAAVLAAWLTLLPGSAYRGRHRRVRRTLPRTLPAIARAGFAVPRRYCGGADIAGAQILRGLMRLSLSRWPARISNMLSKVPARCYRFAIAYAIGLRSVVRFGLRSHMRSRVAALEARLDHQGGTLAAVMTVLETAYRVEGMPVPAAFASPKRERHLHVVLRAEAGFRAEAQFRAEAGFRARARGPP